MNIKGYATIGNSVIGAVDALRDVGRNAAGAANSVGQKVRLGKTPGRPMIDASQMGMYGPHQPMGTSHYTPTAGQTAHSLVVPGKGAHSSIQVPGYGPQPTSSPKSNSGLGVMGILGMGAIGAGVGAATAYTSGGSTGAGGLWGGLIGGGAAALGHSQGLAREAVSSISNLPFASGFGEKAVSRFAAGSFGAGAGYAFSGNRGDDKRRGFNAKRGNKISSSKY
jgi:hypothetical protein